MEDTVSYTADSMFTIMIWGDFLGDPVAKTSSNAGGVGLILAWGTKIPHAIQCEKKKNQTKRKHCWDFSPAELYSSNVVMRMQTPGLNLGWKGSKEGRQGRGREPQTDTGSPKTRLSDEKKKKRNSIPPSFSDEMQQERTAFYGRSG